MRTHTFISRKSSAQAMVEFAIALPVLLLLLYGLLEAGRLLFLYSTVVTASRQAVRYGAATGEGNNGVFRYQDCDGIRAAANAVSYINDEFDVTLAYDQGVTDADPPVPINPTGYCSGSTDSSLNTTILQGNRTRLVVTVTEVFRPIVPNLVPFIQRNITATSARTILYSVPIVVEQEEQEWFKNPTITTIISDDPDPSEIFGSVTVVVKVTGADPPPTGVVDITGADTNCQITLDSDGEGSCTIVFNTAGTKVITAFYNGDADNLASSAVEDHEVILAPTITTITDSPDPTIRNQDFTVVVTVTGGSVEPTGTVEVDGGGGVNCTITLSNGTGSCVLSYNNVGMKTLTATYDGDSSHTGSTASTAHEVLQETPTPTPLPTSTPIPPTLLPVTASPRPTTSLTPSPVPTIVPSCNALTHGAITRVGNVMSMTITNPYSFTIVIDDITVTWNHDKGHQEGGNKTLRLERVAVGATTVWTGDVYQEVYTVDTAATLPPGTTTISFYFHQSYDNAESTDRLLVNLLTPGCENDPINSDN